MTKMNGGKTRDHRVALSPEDLAFSISKRRFMVVFCFLILGLIMYDIPYHESWGLTVVRYFQPYRSVYLDIPMRIFSFIGFELHFVLFPFLFYCGVDSAARFLEFLLESGNLYMFAKLLVQRPRPVVRDGLVSSIIDEAQSSKNEFSFPSGHSLATMATFLYLADTLGVTYDRPKLRLIQFVVLVMLVFGTSFSRIYFGMHYPHDCVAGWALAYLLFASQRRGELGIFTRERISQLILTRLPTALGTWGRFHSVLLYTLIFFAQIAAYLSFTPFDARDRQHDIVRCAAFLWSVQILVVFYGMFPNLSHTEGLSWTTRLLRVLVAVIILLPIFYVHWSTKAKTEDDEVWFIVVTTIGSWMVMFTICILIPSVLAKISLSARLNNKIH